jgi:cell division septal protein FtsQ
MWWLNVHQVRSRLERFAWIDHVTLQKRWPNSVVVTVSETSPVAVAFKSGHVLEYVSPRGRELGVAPLNVNLPTLRYTGVVTPWPYAKAALASAYVASQLPRAFAAQVSVISEDTKGNVSLKMTTPVTFVLGPATNLHAKFVAVASVIAHSTLGPGDVVDVTVPDELAVTGPPPS